MTHAWRQFPKLRELSNASPHELANRIYYDSLVYDPEILAQLISRFGVDRLMIGTDFPYAIHERDPLHHLEALGLTAHEMDLCRWRNAELFLGL